MNKEPVIGILSLAQIVQVYRQSRNQDTRLLRKLAAEQEANAAVNEQTTRTG
jgi:hypothetical protein